MSDDVAKAVVELRQRFPLWGPKKLRAYLLEQEAGIGWPAASTMGELLKRRGLIGERRRRVRTPHATQPLSAATEPNILWATDFKGCYRVAGRYCHPLTVSDGFSRFLVRVTAMEAERFEPVQQAFTAAFEEFGLPLRIRSDNGSPFAARAVGGLSRLAVWWVKLGITPERIEPGHPEQNGQHERMHRTLKAHVGRSSRLSLDGEQAALDEFRRHFNNDRPHEALGQQTPASRYVPSPRRMPDEVPDPEYPAEFEVRRLKGNGCLWWHGAEFNVGAVVAREAVGLELPRPNASFFLRRSDLQSSRVRRPWPKG